MRTDEKEKIEIGSYFPVIENNGSEFHKKAIKLNTARNAIEYILKAKRYKKIYIPYFICDTALEPIHKLNLEYEFYTIDNNLEMKNKISLKKEEVILLVNYYGLKEEYITRISETYQNIIVDNTQSFYAMPLPNIDTIYSCRKFFPVADGSYLYTNKILNDKFAKNLTYNKIEFMRKKYELDSNSAYADYAKNENELCNSEIKYMSRLTENEMRSYDYEKMKLTRERNFLYLHNFFSEVNELNLSIDNLNAPLTYPLMISEEGIREALKDEKIYLATYWPEVLSRKSGFETEKRLAKYILPLPIDHRYGISEMNIMIKQINSYRGILR